jgi:glutamyl endopeptidase
MLRGFPQIYTMSGPIDVVKSHNLFYGIDTSGGQSGSGLWIDKGEKVICCGIHTTGSDKYNSAVRVTDEVVNQVKLWITNMYGADYKKAS